MANSPEITPAASPPGYSKCRVGGGNLVAMTGNTINQSEYKKIENTWAPAIKNGHTVDVNVRMV